MIDRTYTLITFAPIQGFIEKSRKLRDLYGSSYIISLLSRIIGARAIAEGATIVSPALPNIIQGMPNQIVLSGNLEAEQITNIRKAFTEGWELLADSCRQWIETHLTEEEYYWQRNWQLWKQYTWEFFIAEGKPHESITEVRQRINQAKIPRNWTGINWQGESSTLSGSDAIAHPALGKIGDPRAYNYQQEKAKIRQFYQTLSQKLGYYFLNKNSNLRNLTEEEVTQRSLEYGSSFIDPEEELSIPELIKRLITHETINDQFIASLETSQAIQFQNAEEDFHTFRENLRQELNPQSFRELRREKDGDDKQKQTYWSGWFLGDGDSATKYFQTLSPQQEEEQLQEFSQQMREWGKQFQKEQDYYLQKKGRVIYAGGDDFFGILYDGRKPFDPEDNQGKIAPYDCLKLFYNFKSQIWDKLCYQSNSQITEKPDPKKITPSVGFVWAGNQIPQRDVLQHCREAEQSAKQTGRDRVAFRILFNTGTHLEWACPWWLLDEEVKTEYQQIKPEVNLIESYQDKENGKNWTHFYQDVATLKARHAFNSRHTDIALALIDLYFGSDWKSAIADPKNWWNQYDNKNLQTFTGILGDPKQFDPDFNPTAENLEKLNHDPKVKTALNNWVINLAYIGFHLTDNNERPTEPRI